MQSCIIDDDGKVLGIKTTKALDAYRKHFDCMGADHVPLENEGSPGSAGSHWERSILGQEVMTGEEQWEAQYSKITLALLEDSGWYEVDYDMADRLEFGRGKGCNFIRDKCFGDDVFPEFCSVENQFGCDANGDKKVACKAQQF